MKDKILNLLKTNEDYISGEKISEEFGVTRAAIWKNINLLKEEGYEIESITRRGYKLISSPEVLTYQEIESYLKTKFIGRKIYYYKTIDSTNTKAKELAFEEEEGMVVVAEEQYMGKGRLGRSWSSPKNKGIYMSVLLKPTVDPMKVARITLIGAAAVNNALNEMGIKSKIKWPNDIVIEGKKVCGILTEMSGELNMIDHVIMGIGINVNLDKDHIPEELSDKATSLKIESGKEINRRELFGRVLNNLEELYIPFKENGDISKTIKSCKEHSAVLGKEIQMIRNREVKMGKAIDINEYGELIVEFDTGIEVINSGEISIRGINGYI